MEMRKPVRHAAAVFVWVLLLGGCALVTPPPDSAPVATSAPAARPEPARIEAAAPRDDIMAFFEAQEQRRVSDGLLRQSRAPADTPFSVRDLEEAFVQVALFDEYTFDGNRVIERPTPSTLRRWQAPVRMALEFRASVPASVQRADRGVVAAYASRLGRLTGHPVNLGSTSGANFHVLVLGESERRVIGPRLRELVPGLDDLTVSLVQDLPLSVSCLVLAFSRTGTDVYTDAIAVIRAELPDLSRRACYYEELAQGMGLPNDSPRARPSMFNDTAEFAVLTVMDEYMLQMLYDPRLRPGMREREARPIIRRIAQELMGAQS